MLYRATPQRGHALILSVMALALLAGLSAAQVTSYVKNQQQASFFETRSELRDAAESGLAIAVHDFESGAGELGFIGTSAWTTDSDFGADGYPGTLDDGESDGLPTAGEPGVFPVRFGADRFRMRVYTTVVDTAFPNVRRAISTAITDSDQVTVEKLIQTTEAFTIPKVGALFVDPGVALDFNGNAFFISGNDTNPDGSEGSGDDLAALSTEEDPDEPGDNLNSLMSQLDDKTYDQLEGAGGFPSVDESSDIDVNALADQLFAMATPLEPGDYSSASFGNWENQDFQLQAVQGNLTLSGSTSGAGILVVDGSLDISGEFQYYGLILVRGDLRLTGGGSQAHVYGAVMVTDSFSAIDPSDSGESEVTVNGTADIYYSSQVIDAIQNAFQRDPTLSTLYYKES